MLLIAPRDTAREVNGRSGRCGRPTEDRRRDWAVTWERRSPWGALTPIGGGLVPAVVPGTVAPPFIVSRLRIGELMQRSGQHPDTCDDVVETGELLGRVAAAVA